MAPLRLWCLSALLVLLASLLTRFSHQYGPPHVNYDGSVYFSHAHLELPSTRDDIIHIVRTASERGQKVRVVGSGHSWSAVASSDDVLVSLWNYNGVVLLDREAMEVTVKAGTTLKQLNLYLSKQGLAMKNLGSISEQTVAGAISTGTHGNGLPHGNLATLVTKLEFVSGKGELVSASEKINPQLFKAILVSIGMLGIITQVTFSVEEQYLLREVLTQHSLDDCLTNFNSLMTSGEHVKMWTELYSGKCGVFVASRTSETRPRDGPSWTLKNIEIMAMEAVLLVTSWFQFSIPHVIKLLFQSSSSVFSPYDRVDASYRVLEVPQMLPVHWEAELVLPMEGCSEAVRELRRAVVNSGIPANMPIEIRPVKDDDIWLSPNYQRTSCHVTLTLYNPTPHTTHSYFTTFFKIAQKLNLAPRVHWGKYTSDVVGSREVKSMYPQFAEFARIREEMDPQDIFVTSDLQELFGFAQRQD